MRTVMVWISLTICLYLSAAKCDQQNVKLTDVTQCNVIGRAMYCSQRGLHTIPRNPPTNLSTVDFSHNNIRFIQNNTFVNFRHLSVLYLHSCNISAIEYGGFNGLTNLKTLDLHLNKLNYIDQNVFVPLQNLLELKINKNLFHTQIKPQYPNIGSLTSLVSLRIDIFPGFYFGTEFKNLANLRDLIFDDTTGKHIMIYNSSFDGLRNSKIKYISLSFHITTIQTKSFVPFKNLVGLKVDSWWTLSIQEVLQSLDGLQGRTMEYLRLGENVVRTSPTTEITAEDCSILKDICVRELDLHSLGIYDIEITAINRCLEILDISHNFIDVGGKLLFLTVFPKFRVLLIMYNKLIKRRKRWNNNHVSFYFPKSLEFFNMSFADAGTLRDNFTIINAESLTNVDLAHTRSTCRYGRIMGLKTMKVFNISGISCHFPNMNMLGDMEHLLHFVARFISLGQHIQMNLTHFFLGPNGLKHVDLSGNPFLNNFNTPFLNKHRESMRELIITEMKLKTFPIRLIQNLKHLELIDVRDNSIATLNMLERNELESSERKNLRMLLSGNKLVCNCETGTLNFLEWLTNHTRIISDIHDVLCTLENGTSVNIESILIDLHAFTVRCQSTFWLEFAVVLLFMLVFLLGIAAAAYKNKFLIQYYLLRIRKKVNGYNEIREEHRFDGFVCYSNLDSEWVKFFYETLADNQQTRLCLYDKDFQLGVSIAENIIEAIDQSRYVIFIITNNFLGSRWGEFEMEMTRNHIVQTQRRDNTIIILKESIKPSEMPKTLRQIWNQTVCLEWPQEGHYLDENKLLRKREKFWEKIKKLLVRRELELEVNEL